MPTMTTGASVEPDQRPIPDQREATGFPYALMLTEAGRPGDPVVYVNAAFTTLTATRRTRRWGGAAASCPVRSGRARARSQRRCGTAPRWRRASSPSGPTGERSVGQARVVPVAPVGGKADGHADGLMDGHAGGMDRTGDALALAELRHRVRNHLSLVLGMLRLQAAEDEAARDVLTETAGRIEALAFLYAQELDEQGGAGPAGSRRRGRARRLPGPRRHGARRPVARRGGAGRRGGQLGDAGAGRGAPRPGRERARHQRGPPCLPARRARRRSASRWRGAATGSG